MTDQTILDATAYADEAFLVSWSESDKGRRVTLMLSPLAGEKHPFKDFKHGTRFMVVATKIGESEQPEPVKTPAKVGPKKAAPHVPFDEASRGEQARRLCGLSDFQKFLGGPRSFEGAKANLKIRLGLNSTHELDDPNKVGFHEAWDVLRDTFVVETRYGR